MNVPLPPLLVVDDEKNMRLSLQTMLGDEGYGVLAVESAEAGLELLAKENVFMVITDARLGGMSGYDFLHKIRSRWPDVPILMITAYATPKLAVEVIKAGAMDYLAKPFAPEELLHVVSRCAERHRLLQTNAQLLARASETYQLDQIVGDCTKMRELRQLIQTVAPTDARALILGESGTGKELVAGALHSLSHRRRAPYIRINCAAIPETLLESELFGHERGAFTGATKTTVGKIETANGGTLMLDEIGDLPHPLQAKLLRFLQERKIERIGGRQEISVDVRVVCATHQNLQGLISEQRFREDLYYRLAEIVINIPALRQRQGDAVLLAQDFLRRFAQDQRRGSLVLTDDAIAAIEAHRWPGNVRELLNVVRRAVIMADGGRVTAGDLGLTSPASAADPAGPGGFADVDLRRVREEAERQAILSALGRTDGNIAKAAEMLGVSRPTLYDLMSRLSIR